MKSLTVIKQIIPVLSSIQGAGTFSNPLASLTGNWSLTLCKAGMDDRIDLSEALDQVERMGKADNFEAQQDEIATTLALLETLLDDIPAGRVPEYVAPPESYEDVRRRLVSSTAALIAQYRPSASEMEKMRRDAVMLTTLAVGDNGAAAARAAEEIHDLIDRSIDASYPIRVKLLEKAHDTAKRIPA